MISQEEFDSALAWMQRQLAMEQEKALAKLRELTETGHVALSSDMSPLVLQDQPRKADQAGRYVSELAFLSDVWRHLATWWTVTAAIDDPGCHLTWDGLWDKNRPNPEGRPGFGVDPQAYAEMGQFIGDIIVALNPSTYAVDEPEQPFTDTAVRFAKRPFVFAPLPPLDEWEKIDPASAEEIPAGATAAFRHTLRDDLWFNLFGVKAADGETYWDTQICAPSDFATLHGTTVANWVLFLYLSGSMEEDGPFCYRIEGGASAERAWFILADFWQGIAYRFL